MKTGAKTVLALLALLSASGRRTSPTPRPTNAPKVSAAAADIVLIGDSQTGPGGPGDHLAQRLRAAGYRVQVIYKGGQNARYFAFGAGRLAVLQALQRKPRVFVIFLGTNELANIALDKRVLESQLAGHRKLHSLITAGGARALFVGPPDFSPGVKGGGKDPLPMVSAMPLLVPALKDIYGADFIDARPYTPMPHNTIHFSNHRPKGGGLSPSESFAATLAPVVQAKL